MIRKRPAKERGTADLGWLQSHHSFSFGQYFDRSHMGFRSLRVMNEDFIAPGKGFDLHPHSDMEIITLVLEGALQHRDSLGNEGIITPGEIQKMSAGHGIKHSEFNASSTEPVHLYQIWIEPSLTGVPPEYDQREFSPQKNQFTTVVSGTLNDSALHINQDAHLLFGEFEQKVSLEIPCNIERGYWLQILTGRARVATHWLEPGDGVALENEKALEISVEPGTKALLFDLP